MCCGGPTATIPNSGSRTCTWTCGRTVWRAGQEVELTPREYALLETLVLNRNIALTRGQLLADAWGYDYIGESRTVDVHINRVRRKLGLQHEIQTVFKVGYRLNTRGTL